MDEELMREYIRTVKAERRRHSAENMGKVLGAFGKLMPKGIRHPDSLVRNRYLYLPCRKAVTRLV